jgi:hypothetical protein
MILSLAMVILAFRADIHPTADFPYILDEQEVITADEIQPTAPKNGVLPAAEAGRPGAGLERVVGLYDRCRSRHGRGHAEHRTGNNPSHGVDG